MFLQMAMFNFRFPHFGYLYPYNRIPFNYTNRRIINRSNYKNIPVNVNENVENKTDINNNSFNQKSLKNSSITDNNCNTANKNGFLNFIPKNIGPISINIEGLEDINKPLFDFLGIKLYLDDIIIICLLIFLYQQKVQDESLYLILILLLLP